MRFDPNPEFTPATMPWSLVEIGLWIRFGLAGGAVAAASPFLALARELSPVAAGLAFLGGSALAALAYRRTRTLLGAEDPATIAPVVVRSRSASAQAA